MMGGDDFMSDGDGKEAASMGLADMDKPDDKPKVKEQPV